MGRFEERIRGIRKEAESGKITWEEADKLTAEWLSFYKLSLPDYAKLEDSYLYSWKSFNQSTLPVLLKLKIPIYVAYGSSDVIADDCDLLPFYFSGNQKNNLTIKRYNGLEHNFFPVDDSGNVDYENGSWRQVMNTFIDWVVKMKY